MELVSESIYSYKIKKEFEIQLPNNEIITIHKWQIEQDSFVEADWEIVENQEAYDKLSDDEQVDFDDFVFELMVN